MAWLPDFLTWENATTFLNSAFSISLLGALAGAYAGATAAQRIAERTKERDQLLTQIRSTNAAIMVAFGICNAALSLKKQQTIALCETFVAKKNELIEFMRKRKAGEIPGDTPFEFQADLRSLQMPLGPIDVLRTQVYEKLSVSGRPLALVATLAGALSSLADTITNRNNLIVGFKHLAPEAHKALPALYFGLPFGGGHVSTEYADTIEALNTLTDDVIFFSDLLCKDLADHGNRILDTYKTRFKDKLESINAIDFTNARTAGLMPREENYADWLHGFKEPQ